MNTFARSALLSSVLMIGAAGVSHATTVTYNDFSSTAGLTLVGATATAVTGDGPILRLTPAAVGQAGAAYSTAPITLGANATFSTTFKFRFTDTGGIAPADGITFVLAASPTGLGTGGGDLGYGGVGNSVAIEFDTFQNGGPDANSNHVAVDTNGALNNLFLASPGGQQFCGFGSISGDNCMSNGDIWTVTAGYDGTNLTVRAQDGAGPMFTLINNQPINISAILGTNTAFLGFTGGTGSGFENHDILSWSYADTTVLAGIPEPTSWVMMIVGLAGIGAMARRRINKADVVSS